MCHCDPSKRTPCCGPGCHVGDCAFCSRLRPNVSAEKPVMRLAIGTVPIVNLLRDLARVVENDDAEVAVEIEVGKANMLEGRPGHASVNLSTDLRGISIGTKSLDFLMKITPKEGPVE